jgi:8-oxo-dGTP pyrophosphatase MutT (NUDIX family)
MKTWLGCIVFAYKLNPPRLLILENKQTGNITTPSGAVEDGETLEQAASRELHEELGWIIPPTQLKITDIRQQFVYGPQKKERAGDNGINQVLILDASQLPEPQETTDTKNASWVSPEEAQEKITFDDLRDVVSEASQLVFHPGKGEFR